MLVDLGEGQILEWPNLPGIKMGRATNTFKEVLKLVRVHGPVFLILVSFHRGQNSLIFCICCSWTQGGSSERCSGLAASGFHFHQTSARFQPED